MKQQNILHIIPRLGFGGAERIVIDIVRELDKQPNIKCTLIALHPPAKGFSSTENTKGLNYLELDFYKISDKQKRLDFLFDKIENLHPTVIHTHLFEAEFLVRQRILKNVSYFTHCHDNMWQLNIKTATFKFTLKQKLFAFYERVKLINYYKKCNNFFIYISEDTKEYFHQNLPKKIADNGTVIHNAINYKRFTNTAEKKLENNPLQFICIGSLVNKKNQQFLVDVMLELKNSGINANLKLLGDGVNREKILKRINELQLSNFIELVGNVSDVENYLLAADLYLHAATYEPFGLVLLEAMAAGLPCVCYDGKGNRDIIENGKNGYILASPTPEEFATKIKFILHDKGLYYSMSNYSKLFAQKFDIISYVQTLMKAYYGALDIQK